MVPLVPEILFVIVRHYNGTMEEFTHGLIASLQMSKLACGDVYPTLITLMFSATFLELICASIVHAFVVVFSLILPSSSVHIQDRNFLFLERR